MAQNYIQNGKVLTPTLASGTLSGTAVVVGSLVGVALVDIPAGGYGAVSVCGVYGLPKGSEALTTGAPVYLKADGTITATATGNTPAGIAAADAATGAAIVPVLLNGLPA